MNQGSLGASPSPLNFGSVPQGSSKTLKVQISNRDTKPILWYADTSRTRWLALTGRSEDVLQPYEQQEVNVTVDTNSLKIGSYAATLTFISVREPSEGTQVPILLTVSPLAKPSVSEPDFFVSPLAVSLNFVRNQNSSQILPLAISNLDGQNVMSWKVDTGETNWLAVDRWKGDLKPYEQQTIYAIANTSSLQYGDYLNTLTFVTQMSGTDSVIQLQATLHVTPITFSDNGPKPPKKITPDHLDFGSSQLVGNSACLTFDNPQENGVVDWTMGAARSGDLTWVKLDTSDGTLGPGKQQTVKVTVDKTVLRAGKSQGDLLLTFTFNLQSDPSKAGREPTSVPIPITLTVS